eukprot:TRINITY_DN3808_c0_g1_i3.p1 TRINITY_DN3808_c0_g1~~TRINITY_DN3808_c0_g1_i3.p1  ORF type:complete len:195 (+),score=49.30 TRINITY_DN3808_c0_g1_i3:747-1331(+)
MITIVVYDEGRIIVSLGEMGFVRYKKPFVEHLSKEIKERGLLSGCYDSLTRFWEPLLKETTQGYINKTLERPEDREESILFKMLDEGSQQAIEIFDCFDRQEDPLQLLLLPKTSDTEQQQSSNSSSASSSASISTTTTSTTTTPIDQSTPSTSQSTTTTATEASTTTADNSATTKSEAPTSTTTSSTSESKSTE